MSNVVSLQKYKVKKQYTSNCIENHYSVVPAIHNKKTLDEYKKFIEKEMMLGYMKLLSNMYDNKEVWPC